MCAFISANAQVRVVDALDSMPVSAASAFDAKGNMVGYTRGDGVLSEIKASAYPITLRRMGYEQLVIDTPEEKTWQMVPVLFNLPELVVASEERNAMRQTFYAREYFSMTATGDTINFFIEHMAERFIPASKDSKYEGNPTLRICGSRVYANYNMAGEDSTAVESETQFPSMLSLMRLPTEEIKAPVSFKAKDNQNKIHEVKGKSGMSLIHKQNAHSFTTFEDKLAKKKSHSASVWLLKLVGISLKMNQLYITHSYPVNEEGVYLPKDLKEASLVFEADAKGMLIRQMLESDKHMLIRSMVEVYMVDWEYLTQKEAEEEYAKEKKNAEFIIPSSVPPLNEATRRLVEKANSGANL